MSDIPPNLAVVIMGVCGTGKTTVGRELAYGLEAEFRDADDYHPPENVAKMSDGMALTDLDREPWLDRLRGLIENRQSKAQRLVLACSALRESYRERLMPASGDLRFVFLYGERDLLVERMRARTDHYMPPTLLDSQLATLEVPSPAEALWCNVADSPAEILDQAMAYLADPV